MPTSPLPSRRPKTEWKCYVTPAFSGVPNPKRGEHNQKWPPHPCLLGGPTERVNATPPLGAWRWRSQRPDQGTNSEVPTSPLPSRGPKRGRKCYVTPAFSGGPNPKRGEHNQKWPPHPCLLGGPKEGRNATSPLGAWRWRSQRPAQGAKSEVATSPLPSRRPKRARKCYVTPAFSEFPNAKRREQNQKWLPHAYLIGGPKEGGNATPPLHSRGSPMPSAGSKIRKGPQQRGTKSEVATSPLPSRRPKRARKCYVTPALSGVPNAKHKEQNQKGLLHPHLHRGPKQSGNAM